jgi:two-component system, OmpR family, response regulator
MSRRVKRRIMVVDDDQMILRLIKAMLEGTGNYEVHTESNPVHAKEAIQAFRPELMLLDIVMPEVDGGDIAATIQEGGQVHDIPIIFFTGELSKDYVAQHDGVIAGQEFIAKPVTREELVDRIERRLKKSESPRPFPSEA